MQAARLELEAQLDAGKLEGQLETFLAESDEARGERASSSERGRRRSLTQANLGEGDGEGSESEKGLTSAESGADRGLLCSEDFRAELREGRRAEQQSRASSWCGPTPAKKGSSGACGEKSSSDRQRRLARKIMRWRKREESAREDIDQLRPGFNTRQVARIMRHMDEDVRAS
eukprot:1851435-Pleurochrysis_carterae.AAC.1